MTIKDRFFKTRWKSKVGDVMKKSFEKIGCVKSSALGKRTADVSINNLATVPISPKLRLFYDSSYSGMELYSLGIPIFSRFVKQKLWTRLLCLLEPTPLERVEMICWCLSSSSQPVITHIHRKTYPQKKFNLIPNTDSTEKNFL